MNLGPNKKLDDLIHKQLRKIQLERLHGAPVSEPREPVKVVKSMKAKKEKKIRARIKALKKKAKLQLKKGNLKKYKKVAQEIKRLDQKLGTLPTKLPRTKVLKKLGGPKAKKLGKRESMKQISSYIDSKTDKKISEIYDLKGLKMELKKVLFMAAKERENVDPTRYNSLLRRANELKRQLTNVKEISKEIKKSVSVPEVLKQLQQESVYETIYGKDNVPLIARKPSKQPILNKGVMYDKKLSDIPLDQRVKLFDADLQTTISNDQLDDLIGYNINRALKNKGYGKTMGDARMKVVSQVRPQIIKNILRDGYLSASPDNFPKEFILTGENKQYLNELLKPKIEEDYEDIIYTVPKPPPSPPSDIDIVKVLKEVKKEAVKDIEKVTKVESASIQDELKELFKRRESGDDSISVKKLIESNKKKLDNVKVQEQVIKNRLNDDLKKASTEALTPKKKGKEALHDELIEAVSRKKIRADQMQKQIDDAIKQIDEEEILYSGLNEEAETEKYLVEEHISNTIDAEANRLIREIGQEPDDLSDEDYEYYRTIAIKNLDDLGIITNPEDHYRK